MQPDLRLAVNTQDRACRLGHGRFVVAEHSPLANGVGERQVEGAPDLVVHAPDVATVQTDIVNSNMKRWLLGDQVVRLRSDNTAATAGRKAFAPAACGYLPGKTSGGRCLPAQRCPDDGLALDLPV